MKSNPLLRLLPPERLIDRIAYLETGLRAIVAMERDEPASAAYAKDLLNGLPVPTEACGAECAALRADLVRMTAERNAAKAALERYIAEDLERDLYAGEG